MKLAFRLLAVIIFLAGSIILARLSIDNRELENDIGRLEAELGRMSIVDVDRVHLVEIASPNVPPEVAPHVDRVYQFRCYLPAGYSILHINGGGRIAREGLYFSGGSITSWSTPSNEGVYKLLTISLQKRGDHWGAFTSFNGSTGRNEWGQHAAPVGGDTFVVETIVTSEGGPRSFDQDTILPILRAYNLDSAKEESIMGNAITTYDGGLFVLCPKSLESKFKQLKRGETPVDFDAKQIAAGASND